MTYAFAYRSISPHFVVQRHSLCLLARSLYLCKKASTEQDKERCFWFVGFRDRGDFLVVPSHRVRYGWSSKRPLGHEMAECGFPLLSIYYC